jgi:hypothetical protein
MSDWLAGLLAIGIGAIFCFRGYIALRAVIAAWGALVGFVLGASIGGDDAGILTTGLSWILGIVLALLFAVVAYLYYAVSIALAMGSIGFALGASLIVALGISWSWLIVLSGLALGIALAIIALVGDLPTVVLVVLSAAAGASAITGGIMLLAGTLGTDDITVSAAITEQLNDDWYWYVIWIALAVVGVVAQLRFSDRMDAEMRAAWQAT